MMALERQRALGGQTRAIRHINGLWEVHSLHWHLHASNPDRDPGKRPPA